MKIYDSFKYIYIYYIYKFIYDTNKKKKKTTFLNNWVARWFVRLAMDEERKSLVWSI